ncbi:hypothetical protein [Haloarcula sp. CBA1127]|uniref:hypothetical protein n=1 Tax=Haloarcula sp. CBA1127 TaxID=1765055 RepID=UPI000B021B29|nr:hypothetical protein [Haloarcula sp. CBA1127]
MASDRANRRRFLQIGGAALTTTLAGCGGLTDLDNPSGTTESEDEKTETKEQQYTIPPVADMNCTGVENGNAVIEAIYEPVTTPGDSRLFIKDEITFELFSYTTYPVENEIDLKKVAEKTKSPYGDRDIKFKYPHKEIPQNKRVRHRIKATNNNTGESEFIMDKITLVYFNSHYGPSEYIQSDSSFYTIIEEENDKQGGFVKRGDKYIKGPSFGSGWKDPQIADIPFTREAFKVENDLYQEGEYPMCSPYYYGKIEIPVSLVERQEQKMENRNLRAGYNTLNYNDGQDNVLDSPVCQQHADGLIKSQEQYSVKNHYGLIRWAAGTIQSGAYDKRRGGVSVTQASVHLPGPYWVDRTENCVGHSYNLAWLLYHLGYTCGTVYLNRSGQGIANHVGVGIPIPKDVMESDFPEEYPDAFNNSPSIQAAYVDGITSTFANDIDSLGDYPWLYIETTGGFEIGVMPFDKVDSRGVQYVLEPEDNVFGTDLKNQTGS